jgi:hypothetical protein
MASSTGAGGPVRTQYTYPANASSMIIIFGQYLKVLVTAISGLVDKVLNLLTNIFIVAFCLLISA